MLMQCPPTQGSASSSRHSSLSGATRALINLRPQAPQKWGVAAVLTNALQVLCLVIVTIGAVAGVARDLVQTNPSLAHLGAEEGTFVHICIGIPSWA